MRHFTTALLLVVATVVSLRAQTADDYLKSGISKHEQKDYKGAIAEYDKALELSDTLTLALYNRGTVYLALDQYDNALMDLTAVLERDPAYIRAYYNRATVYAKMERYTEALPDLDKLIALKPSFPNALTLRGQLRGATGNKDGACADFQQAKQLGDAHADGLIARLCGEELPEETLELTFPQSEGWALALRQESEEAIVFDYVREDETVQNWTELCNITVYKGAAAMEVKDAMDLLFQQAQTNAPDSKLTLVARDESAAGAWIMFKIESPRFVNDAKPESQFWYVTRGKKSLISSFRAVKEATITDEQAEQWKQFFSTARIVPVAKK